MPCDVKRAYAARLECLLAFLTRLCDSRLCSNPRRRVNARRKRVPARRLQSEVVFGLRERFLVRLHQVNRPVDAPTPYLTVSLGRHEAGRDCDADGRIAVLHD